MSADNLDRDEGLSFLMANGDLAVPCSRYGRTTSECAPIAWRIAELVAMECGEPITEDDLDYAMGLVVNDRDDVEYVLSDHGESYDDIR